MHHFRYRLAAELSERIAAIAPVAGTLAVENPKPKRPVPVMHFHGTADTLVPFTGSNQRTPRGMKFLSVEETIKTWAKLNGCPDQPKATSTPDAAKDGTPVTKKVYGSGKDGAEVVLFVIKDGGHTWPGQQPPVGFLGKSTANISANDLIWDFFVKHPSAGRYKKISDIIEVSSGEFYGKGYQDIDFRVPSIKKAREVIGWEPKVDLDTALRKTIEYYLESDIKIDE